MIEVMINNPQNTRTSSFGISDDSTIPPNRPLEQTDTNAIGIDKVNPISQNQGRQAYTNNESNIAEMTNERHVMAVATVDNAENRNEQEHQIPSGSQENTLPIRPQEFYPNNTASLNDSLAYPNRHQRLESTRQPDNSKKIKQVIVY